MSGIAVSRGRQDWATVGNGVLSLLDQSMASLANLVTAIAVARACTESEFGLYSLGFSLLVFLCGVQTALVGTPLAVCLPRTDPADRRSYLRGSQRNQLILMGLTSGALLCGAFLLGGRQSLTALAWVLVLSSAGVLLRDHVRRVHFAALDMRRALSIDAVASGLQVGGVLLLAACESLSAASACAVLGAAGFVAVARDAFEWAPWRGRASTFRNARQTALSALGSHLAVTSGSKALPWLLAAAHGAAATGVYAACSSLLAAANPFMMGLRNYLTPTLATAGAMEPAAHVKVLVRRATIVVGVVMGPFLFIVAVWGDRILSSVFSARYSGQGTVLGLLAVATIAWSLTAPLSAALVAAGRADLELKSYLFAGGVMATAGAVLVVRHGVVGAALATALSDGAGGLFRAIAHRKVGDGRRRKPEKRSDD